MAICKDIEKLEPEIKTRCISMLQKLDDKGIRYAIIETRRTFSVAFAYYLQGRFPLAEVNTARKNARLYLLSEEENRNKVTELNPNIKRSKHMLGLAFDLAPLKADGRTINWNAPREVWLHIGETGESCGLSWGGRWGQASDTLGWDCPHFEI